MSDLDEELEAAAEEAERELSEDDENEEGDEEEIEVRRPTTPAPPPIHQQVVRRPGKHRRKSARTIAEEATRAATLAAAPPHPPRGAVDGSKNVAIIWQKLIEDMRTRGEDPATIWIRVRRFALGPNRTPDNAQNDAAPIDGAAVCGSETISPGEDLVNYVTDVFHFNSHPPGPAKYSFNFYWKSGASNRIPVPEGELRLGDPREIKQQRDAARLIAERRRMENPAVGMGYLSPSLPAFRAGGGVQSGYYVPQPGGVQSGYYVPQPAQPPQPPPASQLPPLAGASPELEEMRRQLYQENERLARLGGVYEERARMEGVLAQRPVAAASVENSAEVEARIAASVIKALMAAGAIPTPGVGGPPLKQETVSTLVESPMAAAKSFFNQMREFKKMEQEMSEMFAPTEEEPEPPSALLEKPPIIEVHEDPYKMKEIPLVGQALGLGALQHGPRKEGESFIDYMIRLGMHNPGVAMKVGRSLQTGVLSQVVKKALENTAVGQVMAAQQSARVVEMPTAAIGTNGAPPQAPQPAEKSFFRPG